MCHIAILICSFAHFLRSKKMVAATIGIVAFPHLFWTLDFVIYLVAGVYFEDGVLVLVFSFRIFFKVGYFEMDFCCWC